MNGSPRRCLGMSSATGSDLGAARATIAVDPADGDLTIGDDVVLEVGYNYVNLVFTGEVQQDSGDLSPFWIEATLVGQLWKASRKTNIIDEEASGVDTGGILGDPPEIP